MDCDNRTLLEEVIKLVAKRNRIMPNASIADIPYFTIHGDGILQVAATEIFHEDWKFFQTYWRQAGTVAKFFQDGGQIDVNKDGTIDLRAPNGKYKAHHYLLYLMNAKPFFKEIKTMLGMATGGGR